MRSLVSRMIPLGLALFFLTGCVDLYTVTLLDNPPSYADAQPHSRKTTETVELTLVSYNVAALSHGGDRTDGIVAFLKEVGADLVGLNELDSCNARHNVFQLEVLADRMGGWGCHFASAFPFAGGGYGNGVMSCKPLIRTWTVALERGGGHEPRSPSVLETEDVVFASTHLDFGPPGAPSYEQAVALHAWFKDHFAGYGKPVILCGDFNTDPGTATQDEMQRCWVRLSEPVLTWPTVEPTMCLDYVYYLKTAVPVEATETARPQGSFDLDALSDHYPVRVRIRFDRKRALKMPPSSQ